MRRLRCSIGPIPDDQGDSARSIGFFRERIDKIEVLRHVHVFREMKKDVITKKVLLESQGSPSMTMYVHKRLKLKMDKPGTLFMSKDGASAPLEFGVEMNLYPNGQPPG